MTQRYGRQVGLRNPTNSGLTLIEVLVALSLLALVSVSLVTATGAGLQTWLTARDAMLLDRRVADGNAQLLAAIGGMVPMPVTAAREQGGPFPFFQGEAQMMRFVTAHSTIHRGRGGFRLLAIRVVSGVEGLELIVEESPCPDSYSLGALVENPARQSDGSVRGRLVLAREFKREDAWTVADRLAHCRFTYLRGGDGRNRSSVWLSRWDDWQGLPRAVRIELVARTTARPTARLQPRRVTAAVFTEPSAPEAWF